MITMKKNATFPPLFPIRGVSKLSLTLALLTTLITATGCDTFQSSTSNDTSGAYSASRASGPAAVSGFTGFDDVPVPADATMDLEKSMAFGVGDAWAGRIALNTSMDFNETFDFYMNNMDNYGWNQITVTRGEVSVLTYQRGSRFATVAITPRSILGTRVEFSVSPKGSYEPQRPDTSSRFDSWRDRRDDDDR